MSTSNTHDHGIVTGAEKRLRPTPPPKDFVIGALPRGELGLLIGADGSGKSGLAIQMAVAVACGLSVAEGAIEPPTRTGPALYVQGEDGEDHLTEFFQRCPPRGLDDVRVLTLDGARMPLIAAGRQSARIEENSKNIDRIKKLAEGTRLIILDPLIMFHNLSEGDNAHQDALARLLIRVARDVNAAILVVHHTGQGALLDMRDDHQSGRGATALACAARCVYVIRRLSDKEVKSEKADGRIGNVSSSNLRYLRASKTSRMAEPARQLLEFDRTGMLGLAGTPVAPQEYVRRAQVGYPAQGKQDGGFGNGCF